jgi:hypothetical protein
VPGKDQSFFSKKGKRLSCCRLYILRHRLTISAKPLLLLARELVLNVIHTYYSPPDEGLGLAQFQNKLEYILREDAIQDQSRLCTGNIVDLFLNGEQHGHFFLSSTPLFRRCTYNILLRRALMLTLRGGSDESVCRVV